MNSRPTYSEEMTQFFSFMYQHITDQQRDTLDLFLWSKGEEDGGDLAALAILASSYGVTHPAFSRARYTEDFHNALQRLQEAGEALPQGRDLYEYAAAYVRREWLHAPDADPEH
jgi:hypothetical protein